MTLPPMVLCKTKCSSKHLHPINSSNNSNSNSNLLKDLPTKSTGSRAFPKCPTVLQRLPFITLRNSQQQPPQRSPDKKYRIKSIPKMPNGAPASPVHHVKKQSTATSSKISRQKVQDQEHSQDAQRCSS